MVKNVSQQKALTLAPDKNVLRALGLAFLVVIVLSIAGAVLLGETGWELASTPDNLSEIMVGFANNPMIVQTSIIVFLIEAVAIVILATLLFSVLKKQNKIIAQAALGLWIIEAVFIAIRQVNVFAFLHVSQEYVLVGSPAVSYFHTLASLFYGLMQFSYDAQMIFYCFGGLLFYYLFFKSNYIPKWLSILGIIAVILGFIGEVLIIFGNVGSIYFFLPILLFELLVGLVLIKGIKSN